MSRKYNTVLFIILTVLICFLILNNSLKENIENNNKNCGGKITCILKNGESQAHCDTQKAKKTAEINNCGMGTSSSDLSEITKNLEK
jgi:hypothetical protein